jgi:hypothetical protein
MEDDYDAMWALSDALGYVRSKGASPDQINDLPVVIFQRKLDITRSCSICLSEFHVGDRMKRMPGCLHLFHAACLDPWLSINATCPICREPLPELPCVITD